VRGLSQWSDARRSRDVNGENMVVDLACGDKHRTQPKMACMGHSTMTCLACNRQSHEGLVPITISQTHTFEIWIKEKGNKTPPDFAGGLRLRDCVSSMGTLTSEETKACFVLTLRCETNERCECQTKASTSTG
jgi:hypothetical protein